VTADEHELVFQSACPECKTPRRSEKIKKKKGTKMPIIIDVQNKSRTYHINVRREELDA
jgi:predicted nucleic-acid-binding Zn-ribbon protein